MLKSTIVFLLLVIYQGHAIEQEDKVFVLKQAKNTEDKSQLLVVRWSSKSKDDIDGCELFDDETLIQQVLNSNSGTHILETNDEEELQNILKDCIEVSMRKRREAQTPQRTHNEELESLRTEEESIEDQDYNYAEAEGDGTGVTTEGYDGWNVIFPGTKWCGAGDIAKDYNDLGLHSDTDKCCRAHDLCNDTLAPGASKNGLKNTTPFTQLSCQCDNDFYDCLSNVDSMVSNKIGNMYFNLLRRSCYELDFPLTRKCKTYRTFLKLTCKEYARNMKAPKVYQWKSPKLYKKLPFPGPITITLPF